MGMNVGERGEILVKLKLIDIRDNNETLFGDAVYSVGFEREYSRNSVNLRTLSLYGDEELSQYAISVGVTKASVRDKSDVYINNVGISLKSTSGANSALINHTPRPGYERVCHELHLDIDELDEIIDEYWELRLDGQIGEDVSLSDPLCPFRGHKKYFGKILQYFLFNGSGNYDSDNPASYLLEFEDPLDTSTWKLITQDDAIDRVWDKLVFSVRSKKGMPTDYSPFTYHKPNAESIKRWVKFCDGSYKGALHVRVKER